MGQQAPKWPVRRIAEVGHRALELAQQHRADLEERLAPALLDGLAADLAIFEGKRSETMRAPAELAALTRDQERAAETAHALVVAVRQAIARVGGTPAQRKEFGVGMRVDRRNVARVVAGLDAVIAACSKYPELSRQAGVLTSDIEKARALRAALVTADARQEAKKQARKLPTAQRNAAARRIAAAVDAIIAAGLVRFCDDPSTAKDFLSLVPSSSRARPAPEAPKPNPS